MFSVYTTYTDQSIEWVSDSTLNTDHQYIFTDISKEVTSSEESASEIVYCVPNFLKDHE